MAELAFNVVFGIDEVTFGTDFNLNSQSIEVGFDHMQVVTRDLEDYQIYHGSYSITPSIESQTLETKDRRMDEDLKILEIPYYETSNQSGTTVIIGG